MPGAAKFLCLIMQKRKQIQPVILADGIHALNNHFAQSFACPHNIGQIAGHGPKQLIIFDIYENNVYEIEQELKRKYKAWYTMSGRYSSNTILILRLSRTEPISTTRFRLSL